MSRRSDPPLDYLRTASRSLLQSFELSRLNHASNLREEITILLDQWVEQTAEAMLARWMLDHHKSFHPQPPPQHEPASQAPAAAILPDESALPSVLPVPQAPPRYAPARPALMDRVAAKRPR